MRILAACLTSALLLMTTQEASPQDGPSNPSAQPANCVAPTQIAIDLRTITAVGPKKPQQMGDVRVLRDRTHAALFEHYRERGQQESRNALVRQTFIERMAKAFPRLELTSDLSASDIRMQLNISDSQPPQNQTSVWFRLLIYQCRASPDDPLLLFHHDGDAPNTAEAIDEIVRAVEHAIETTESSPPPMQPEESSRTEEPMTIPCKDGVTPVMGTGRSPNGPETRSMGLQWTRCGKYSRYVVSLIVEYTCAPPAGCSDRVDLVVMFGGYHSTQLEGDVFVATDRGPVARFRSPLDLDPIRATNSRVERLTMSREEFFSAFDNAKWIGVSWKNEADWETGELRLMQSFIDQYRESLRPKVDGERQ